MKVANLNLLPLRKSNSHRPLPAGLTYLLSFCRKVIETTGSLIERLLSKHIHAVTARGFETQDCSLCHCGVFQCLLGGKLGYLCKNGQICVISPYFEQLHSNINDASHA